MSNEFEEGEESFKHRGMGRYRDRIVNGPIISTLIWLGLPPLINNIVMTVYHVANAYWLSIYSTYSVSVPRQTWPVIMLFQAFLNALTAANLSIISQYIGAKMYKEASLSASKFFTVTFSFGVIFCITFFSLREFIFSNIVSVPLEIFDEIMKYSGIISLDVFFGYISFTYLTLLQSVGDTKRPALINVIAVTTNAILDPFLILGIGFFPRLGVIGASITDVVGKIISIIGLTYILKKNYPDLKVGFTKNIDIDWIKMVMHIGVPIIFLGLTNSFAFIFQLRLVNAFGVIVATAYSIGFVIMDIVDGALWGFMGANSIMIGQNLGANKFDRAKEIACKTALLVFSIIIIGSIIIYPFKINIIRAFTDNLEVINETDIFLQTLLPTLAFFSLFMIGMSTGRGSGHTLIPTILGMIRLWGIRIFLGYVLAFNLGMGSYGVWLALAISNFIGGILSMLWIKYGKWNKAIIKKTRIM
ncbi:MAG: MATE family efflux transporter [Candidatus Methanomethylicia archaeon]|nr:MATE family efflux transporter [Candidatus Methanomethylicia archaeon]MDW7989029.1 MATE family efflux transporter [Nitrososphaerota archaeon]